VSDDYRLDELAPGVYARLGRGPVQPNCAFVVGDEGVMLFDSSYSPAAGRAIARDVARVTSKPIATLVLSHHHWDHAWGAQVFGGARVIAHAGARQALRERAAQQLGFLREQPDRPASWMEIPPAQLVRELDELQISLPVLTYSETLSVWSGDREIQLRHLGPAHTYGDTLLVLPAAGILFGGDVVCNRLIPVVGDGDPFGFVEVLDRVAGLGATTIVPGHGRLAGPRELAAFRACLMALCDEVRAARSDGAADAEAALAAVRLADFTDWAGHDLLRGSVRRIWEQLAAREAQ
jgi:cyclase